MRDICFLRLANDECSARNCAEIGSVDYFFSEIDVGGNINYAKVYGNDLFLGDRASTALNLSKCKLQLH